AYVDFALVVTNSFVLLITSAVGTAANLFVILAVCRQKSLQTSVNAPVVNLAVVDFLRCTVDCPVLLHVIVTLHRGGHVDRLICDTQTASFSFSCCIQLSTLGCISAERYQAIANPFKTTQRKRRMMALIPLTWLLGVSLAAVCQVFLKDSPVYVRCKEGQRGASSTYDTVGLYVLLPLWVSCFGLITGFYARIFALLRSHNRKIFDEGTSVPSKDSKEDKHTPAVQNGETQEKSKSLNRENQTGESPKPESSVKENSLLIVPSTQLELPKSTSVLLTGPKQASKERARKRKETKMAKRAGYIIITFLLFWLPLITTILVNFLVHRNREMQTPVIQDMEILSVSVSCITSLSDPIIYAAVNPQFRSEFYKLRSWVKSR
uniref:G-protein coupled receptors family 1 profile domain-containing protein n=1 Tax=Poecilia formosa TaxID=48698 RepID=A0A096LUA9_POEFO